jgi:hypothetical protein
MGLFKDIGRAVKKNLPKRRKKKMEQKQNEATEKNKAEEMVVKSLKDYKSANYELRFNKITGDITGYIGKSDGTTIANLGGVEDYIMQKWGGGQFTVTIADKSKDDAKIESYNIQIGGVSKLDQEAREAKETHRDIARYERPPENKEFTESIKAINDKIESQDKRFDEWMRKEEEKERAKEQQAATKPFFDLLTSVVPTFLEQMTKKEDMAAAIGKMGDMFSGLMKTSQEITQANAPPAQTMSPEMMNALAANSGDDSTSKLLEMLATTLGPIAGRFLGGQVNQQPQAPIGTPDAFAPQAQPQAVSDISPQPQGQPDENLSDFAVTKIWNNVAASVAQQAPPAEVAATILMAADTAEYLGFTEHPAFSALVKTPLVAYDQFSQLLQADEEYKRQIRAELQKQVNDYNAQMQTQPPSPMPTGETGAQRQVYAETTVTQAPPPVEIPVTPPEQGPETIQVVEPETRPTAPRPEKPPVETPEEEKPPEETSAEEVQTEEVVDTTPSDDRIEAVS